MLCTSLLEQTPTSWLMPTANEASASVYEPPTEVERQIIRVSGLYVYLLLPDPEIWLARSIKRADESVVGREDSSREESLLPDRVFETVPAPLEARSWADWR